MIKIVCKILDRNRRGMTNIHFEFNGIDKQECIDAVEHEMDRLGFYSYQLSVESE